MKIPVGLKIACLTIAATAFYTYVGQLVPQKEVLPPQETEMKADMTAEDLVQVGNELMTGKGMCLTCHTIGQSGALRFPDLAGIGSKAGTRVPGKSDVEYLAESLYAPDEFIVPGFNPGMPVINKPPIALSDQEILAVIAYLQSLGGTVTVGLDTRLPYMEGGAGAASSTPVEAAAATAASAAPAGEEELLRRLDCASCHHLDGPGVLQAASLHDVGARQSENQIFAALVNAGSAHGGAAYLKTATIEDLRRLAGFLARKRGTP